MCIRSATVPALDGETYSIGKTIVCSACTACWCTIKTDITKYDHNTRFKGQFPGKHRSADTGMSNHAALFLQQEMMEATELLQRCKHWALYRADVHPLDTKRINVPKRLQMHDQLTVSQFTICWWSKYTHHHQHHTNRLYRAIEVQSISRRTAITTTIQLNSETIEQTKKIICTLRHWHFGDDPLTTVRFPQGSLWPGNGVVLFLQHSGGA